MMSMEYIIISCDRSSRKKGVVEKLPRYYLRPGFELAGVWHTIV